MVNVGYQSYVDPQSYHDPQFYHIWGINHQHVSGVWLWHILLVTWVIVPDLCKTWWIFHPSFFGRDNWQASLSAFNCHLRAVFLLETENHQDEILVFDTQHPSVMAFEVATHMLPTMLAQVTCCLVEWNRGASVSSKLWSSSSAVLKSYGIWWECCTLKSNNLWILQSIRFGL